MERGRAARVAIRGGVRRGFLLRVAVPIALGVLLGLGVVAS